MRARVWDEAREWAAVEHHPPGDGIVKARDTLEERPFASTVRPDQAAGTSGYFGLPGLCQRGNSDLLSFELQQ
jgi:hypothetical protein